MECQRIFDQNTNAVVEQNVSDQSEISRMSMTLKMAGD